MTLARILSLAVPVMVILLGGTPAGSRSLPISESDIRTAGTASTATVLKYCAAAHNVGKIVLGQTNYGVFGAGYITGTATDCFTGAQVPSCEYPKGSGTQYLYGGAFWIGAVVGRDTLVSQGADGWQRCREFNPEASPLGDLKKRSIIDPSKPEFEGARSEQDLIGVYTDKYTIGQVPDLCTDVIDHRSHRPLNIQIEERSYAWSYSYAEDFVLFDYTIKNNSTQTLHQVYMGIYVDADVGAAGDLEAANDDVCGFVQTLPSPTISSGGCTDTTNYDGVDYIWRDEVNLAWIADNDGDWDKQIKVPNVTGTRIVRTPNDTLSVSFNWWVGNVNPTLDYGPQRVATYRDLGTGGRGTPEGDRNKYAFLKNKEFDYDQAFTCRYALAADWVPLQNSSLCYSLSKGYDTRYLLSFGPFTMSPGENLPLSFAYVGGEGLHRFNNQQNGKLLTDPSKYNPEQWYANLDFSDFALNAVWASWIYDNPGVASIEGGNRGKYRICDITGTPDTIYYTGDGVPDFKGATPPPAPFLWVYPIDHRLRVRFNGFRSETTKDVFSNVIDFEGYRVYCGLDDRSSSFSLVESYDIADYNKYIYNPNKNGGAGFDLKENPYTYALLDSLYGQSDTTWDPLRYTVTNPFHYKDSIFYFAKQDYNQSRLGVDTRITKIYPDAPRPPYGSPDSVPAAERPLYVTDDGYFKYYEYQMYIDNLLPTIPYYVNVTAFDFGSPSSGLASLETSPTVGYKSAYAIGSFAQGTTSSDKVYVFPNPYRIDGGYQRDMYEGRDAYSRDKASDRQRRIHFANVPLKCTIRIFTLDGDLVREIQHPDPQSPCQEDPSVACWDMITRNTQLIVSGIYYWTVEDDKGNTQIGKFVVIM